MICERIPAWTNLKPPRVTQFFREASRALFEMTLCPHDLTSPFQVPQGLRGDGGGTVAAFDEERLRVLEGRLDALEMLFFDENVIISASENKPLLSYDEGIACTLLCRGKSRCPRGRMQSPLHAAK